MTEVHKPDIINTTCHGPDAIPDPSHRDWHSVIPQNINFAFLPAGGGNASSPWINRCCSKHISVIDNCYMWCEMPGAKHVPEGVDEKHLVMSTFRNCLRMNGRNISESNIVGYHFGGDATRVVGIKGALIWLVLGWTMVAVLV
ncbi:hypothetical protein QBC34DRAFT_379510 [Podospora aff. communis PSN243]|uniref:Uncharacterized protein n=1 Tax=Podospora aff. communis PSN243 TaxID=3040156 RepID=A0AAV9GNX8_9PEZI|nr:hypothetical protein QBC34DRAFT_379510 [Podospora aff. communis PSN243]